jgi:two-component system, sensor histidine kinase and response regulator
VDPEALLEEFRSEAAEQVRILEQQLLQLERAPSSASIREMFRSAHTIKGGAALLGIADVLEVAHALEDVLGALRGGTATIDGSTVTLLLNAVDILRDGVSQSRPGMPLQDARRAGLVKQLRQRALGAASADSSSGASHQQPRALVVDNSATVRMLSSMLLSDAGFQVDVVADGERALAKVQSGNYDLLVTAIETVGLNGFELAAAVRSSPAVHGLPIILTSSNQSPQNRLRAEELGVQVFLPKGSPGDKRLAEVAQQVLRQHQEPSTAARGRVLLVDDSGLNQLVTRTQLETLEYSVDVADDGRQALEALARSEYGAVLMDCHMPQMDGFEASARIREREGGRRHTPIIALTADTSEEDRARCLAAGMDDFLTKPVQLDELGAVLSQWTHSGLDKLDPSSLRSLRALRQPGKPDPVPSLVEVFVDEGRARVAECRRALTSYDQPALRAAAHALKGSSGTFGAVELQRVAAELERTPDASMVARLVREFELAVRALREMARAD